MPTARNRKHPANGHYAGHAQAQSLTLATATTVARPMRAVMACNPGQQSASHGYSQAATQPRPIASRHPAAADPKPRPIPSRDRSQAAAHREPRPSRGRSRAATQPVPTLDDALSRAGAEAGPPRTKSKPGLPALPALRKTDPYDTRFPGLAAVVRFQRR
ncbi:hypothetical protein Aab01nite_21990 [Paractinoplanes abujensis]|nr:hypothetical protein Aab01nite_21990 [Actinoplanes abujensis]